MYIHILSADFTVIRHCDLQHALLYCYSYCKCSMSLQVSLYFLSVYFQMFNTGVVNISLGGGICKDLGLIQYPISLGNYTPDLQSDVSHVPTSHPLFFVV